MDTRRARALAEGLGAVMVWGASFIATKVALAEVSPATVVWLRFAMGVAVLAVAVLASRQWATVSARTLGTFTLLGLIGITFHQWLQSNALVTSRASTSGWIVATTPVFMAILGRVVLKERLGAVRIAGIALAALGVVLVVTRGEPGALLHGQLGAPGDILIVVSAPNWAVFSVLSRRALRSHPAIRTMAYVMATGWLFSSLLLAAGPGLSEVPRLSARGWGAIAFLGVACSGLAYIAWYDALQRMPASDAGALLYLEPLIAMGVAAAVLHEPVTAATVIGGAVILVGVWLVNRTPAERAGRDAIALGPGEE
ncbi:MAG TPA: DMT family transporter [Thermoanaerobaculaceae bacterium]|nr:DMT family transporter [Thermoanaerobaculaceae bacterium]